MTSKGTPPASSVEPTLNRRALLGAAVAGAAATLVADAEAAKGSRWTAKPPAGFSRWAAPGKVVRVHKSGSLQANGHFPKADAARVMLERAMTELTGKSDLKEAFAVLVHPKDKVAIKPNGIAGKSSMKMAANKELVLEVVKAIVAVGVAPANITIFEQYRDFLFATRVVTDRATLALAPEFPKGVKTAVHLNRDTAMDGIRVNGIETKYVRPFTDATAVINITQLKDHSICGYTGAMKNITHGCNINPHAFHDHNASPQIAHLYAQGVVKSRVVLHIKDAYQAIYDEGPIDRNPKRRVPQEAIYVSTDPVALDVLGWKVVEKLRKENGLPTLKAAGREPTYLRVASELGLGIYDDNRIRLRDVTL
jgi:uncharacterized protein (DUF362 family)